MISVYYKQNLITALYKVSQKNALSERCWGHSALAQSQVAGSPCVWKLMFWSFLIKTKPDQAFPSLVHSKTLKPLNYCMVFLYLLQYYNVAWA